MAWKTLYVTGRFGFDEALLDRLERSDIDFLTGSFNLEGTYLFWVPEDFNVRDLKRLLGARIVFKYRMRFFFAIDAFVSSRDHGKRTNGFTSDQEQMFRELNN